LNRFEVKVGASGEEAEPALAAVKQLEGNYQDVKNDSVGSQIGKELKKKGITAIIFALVGIIIYISIRFEFAFAMGAIAALVHDVLFTVGIYCLCGRELSMPIIAALLTIVGYSVNDTIVVFDRIREDLKLEKGKSYKEIANLSINQTLSRTVLTSLTTLLTVIMLLIFGGGAVNDFALALLIGILVGTYSSIFVATPVVLLWHKEEKVK
jgi:preprotein translocase SecF subunit